MPARRKWRSEIGKPAGSIMWAAAPRHAHRRRIVPVFWGISGWKRAMCIRIKSVHPLRGMSDVNDPDIGILDEIVDPVWISRDQAAPQFRRSCVANSQVGPRSNES